MLRCCESAGWLIPMHSAKLLTDVSPAANARSTAIRRSVRERGEILDQFTVVCDHQESSKWDDRDISHIEETLVIDMAQIA